jgi:hypothetical protein
VTGITRQSVSAGFVYGIPRAFFRGEALVASLGFRTYAPEPKARGKSRLSQKPLAQQTAVLHPVGVASRGGAPLQERLAAPCLEDAPTDARISPIYETGQGLR